ncbi:hypothetical protein TRFO_33603 [Tritrichomonas foetus]|uniref:Uncharacterized protein n=1 Tax=Tritrichomonas foetus TaxID=1144522 RepID=A0A1J4JQQ6_9EUKA|nr:hypothetical protein TRFO_33603 [Tritrichomonas foetus]|eukprot:OHS99853.1 hypothetical protein TRFO_33603 [Tritrichomonas foetus]
MSDEEKSALLKEILDLQTENQQLIAKHETFSQRKAELLKISESLCAQIATRAEKEIQSIGNEREFISQKCVHDEEEIQADFQTKLDQVLKQKEDLQRKLEAESEFVSRNLKERLAKIRQRTLELRSELLNKSKKITESLAEMKADDVIKQKIADNQEYAIETAKRIAESHREIEGLQAKGKRLQSILESLTSQLNDKEKMQNNQQNLHRLRRRSTVTKRPAFDPDMS